MRANIPMNKKRAGREIQIAGCCFLLASLFFPVMSLYAGTLETCLMEAIQYADDSMTVGELRKQCLEEAGTISRDRQQEGSAVNAGENGPAEMVLKTSLARKPAFFPHRTHQEKYSCGACHHGRNSSGEMVGYTSGMPIGKCLSCHNEDMPNQELNGFQLIGHKLCRECHRTHQNITSAKCSTCHPKDL